MSNLADDVTELLNALPEDLWERMWVKDAIKLLSALRAAEQPSRDAVLDSGLQFTLETAKNLVDAFGGEEGDVTVRWLPEGTIKPDDDDPADYKSPSGLYLHFTDYPEEGVICLEPSEQPPKRNMDSLDMLATPVINEQPAETAQFGECGFDRNASISEDRYVCACGREEHNSPVSGPSYSPHPNGKLVFKDGVYRHETAAVQAGGDASPAERDAQAETLQACERVQSGDQKAARG